MRFFIAVLSIAMIYLSFSTIKHGWEVCTELKAKQQQTLELIAKGN